MSLWLTYPLLLPSLIVGVHRAVGDVAIAGIYHRAAVFHGGDDRQNRSAGGHLRRFCLVGFLAGIQRLCAWRGDP